MMIKFHGHHFNMLLHLEIKYFYDLSYKQDIIDFLILNGANFSIIDKTNRNAQDIANFLRKNIDVTKVIKEKEREKIYSMEHLFDIKFNFEQKHKRKIIEVLDNESSSENKRK